MKIILLILFLALVGCEVSDEYECTTCCTNESFYQDHSQWCWQHCGSFENCGSPPEKEE